MFNFGFFSSHIPYILIVGAYLFFFLNGVLHKKDIESNQEKHKEISFDKFKKIEKGQTCYFSFYKKKLSIQHQLTAYFKSFLSNKPLIETDYTKPVNDSAFDVYFFKRPPPFVLS